MQKLLVIIVCIPLIVPAQIMNTARVLKRERAAIQVYPSFHGQDPYIFLAGEYGLKDAKDLQINFGAGETPYLGANLEKVLKHSDVIISAAGGAHLSSSFGLNAAGNLTYPMSGVLDIYTGLDLELNFEESMESPVWIYLGNAINYKRDLQFFLEVALGLEAENIISLGINYNFGRF